MSHLRRNFTRVFFEPQGLGSISWEDRRKLTAAQLIQLMGTLHVNHPAYIQRGYSPLVPLPNLAGRQPVWECSDPSFWTYCKWAFAWMAR